MTTDISILQAARLKGRPTAADLATTTGLSADDIVAAVEPLVADGLLDPARERFKLTAEGRVRLEALVKEERLDVDQAGLKAAYEEFDAFNGSFKQLVTDWQLIDGTRPNDHTDAAYDAAIVERLAGLDADFDPLLGRLVALAPRLAPYPERFAGALRQVVAGDHIWIARPLIDSYHTVWFELHEDLIGLAGLSRAAEAAAGRAE